VSGAAGATAGERTARAPRFVGLGFVWAAIVTALTGGFGLATVMLAGLLLGLPAGGWWGAAAQAHGFAQLAGWAGLMVLGVGLHFLPRLRGAPLAHPDRRHAALWLLVAGLALRLLGQPLAAALPAAAQPPARWLGLGLGGLLMLAGAGTALSMLLATCRAGPPLAERPALRQVLPLLAAGFGAFLFALALNAALGLLAAAAGTPLLPAPGAGLVAEALLLGFLVPVSLAVSTRFFPLYLGLRPAPPAGLRAALGLLLAGLALRALAIVLPGARPAGDLLAGGGLLAGLWSVGQYAPRQIEIASANRPEWLPTGLFRPQPPPPGRARPQPPAQRAARLLLRCAYGWLAVAALLALAAAAGWAPPADLERHALGAGFLTLLILGMGTLLLPGFLGGKAPDAPVVASLVLGNLAAALRVLPGLAAWLAPGLLPGALPAALLGLAGLLGLGAAGSFALMVRGAGLSAPIARDRRDEPAGDAPARQPRSGST
jgi:uncharacterized protein involved in response to NO